MQSQTLGYRALVAFNMLPWASVRYDGASAK
jgi:hypothetical protein